MDHIETAASVGIQHLFDYGASMTIMVLSLCAAVWFIRYLLNRCDERFEEALKRHEDTTSRMGEVLDRNTTTYAQSVILLADVKNALQTLSNRRD